MADNKLESVPAGIQNPPLENIDLSGNQITKFSKEQIESLLSKKKLVSLNLYDNPWKCDCDLVTLHDWLSNDTKPTGGFEAVCAGRGSCPVCKDPANIQINHPLPFKTCITTPPPVTPVTSQGSTATSGSSVTPKPDIVITTTPDSTTNVTGSWCHLILLIGFLIVNKL